MQFCQLLDIIYYFYNPVALFATFFYFYLQCNLLCFCNYSSTTRLSFIRPSLWSTLCDFCCNGVGWRMRLSVAAGEGRLWFENNLSQETRHVLQETASVFLCECLTSPLPSLLLWWPDNINESTSTKREIKRMEDGGGFYLFLKYYFVPVLCLSKRWKRSFPAVREDPWRFCFVSPCTLSVLSQLTMISHTGDQIKHLYATHSFYITCTQLKKS